MVKLDGIKEAHARFTERADRIISAAAEDAGKDALVFASDNTGYRNRTGTLTEANRYQVVRVGGKVARVRLYNPRKYAAPIDKGSKRHEIPPRRANGMLVFFWHKIGKWVYTKLVKNHPGNKPYRFLYNATKHAGGQFSSQVERELTALAKKF